MGIDYGVNSPSSPLYLISRRPQIHANPPPPLPPPPRHPHTISLTHPLTSVASTRPQPTFLQARALSTLGFTSFDAGSRNRNESGAVLTNQCFYLSLAASALTHGIRHWKQGPGRAFATSAPGRGDRLQDIAGGDLFRAGGDLFRDGEGGWGGVACRGDTGGGHSSGAGCGGHGGGRGERGEIGGEGDNGGGGIGEGGGGGGSDGGGGWDGSGAASSDTAGGHRVARGAAPACASPLHQLALYYKRVLEQAVLRAHPEWAGSHVGEEVRLRAPPAAARPSCAYHSQCNSQSIPNVHCPRPNPPPTLSDVFCHGVRLSTPLSHLALPSLPPPRALRLFTQFKIDPGHLSRTGASLLRLSMLRSTLAHASVAPCRRSFRC